VPVPQVFREGTLGDKVRELTLPGLKLTEARFTPNRVLPWHAHERASFCLLLNGTYTEDFRNASYALKPFDLTFKPDGAEHRDRYDASRGAQCLIIDLDKSLMGALRDKGPVLAAPWFFSSAGFPAAGRCLYGEFIEPDDLTALAVEATCAELIVEASRRSRASPAPEAPPWLRRVRDLLHSDFQKRLTLDLLARVADVHPVHLAQTFQRTYTCTIGEYVRNLRVLRAEEELTRTRRPLADIAVSCGFYDQSHFNRVFKRHRKMTPAQYRRSSAGSH
jgi:AraC family transcriptional regulator